MNLVIVYYFKFKAKIEVHNSLGSLLWEVTLLFSLYLINVQIVIQTYICHFFLHKWRRSLLQEIRNTIPQLQTSWERQVEYKSQKGSKNAAFRGALPLRWLENKLSLRANIHMYICLSIQVRVLFIAMLGCL